MSELLLIVPTAAGVRVVVNGLEYVKPMTAEQLVSMGVRFVEAGTERMRSGGVGSWDEVAE